MAVGAAAAFMVGLIASPAVEWSAKLPELGALLKEKLHVFDRPLALSPAAEHARRPRYAHDIASAQDRLGQPTLEFLSPTFAEFLLFIER